jgi:penicillin-binding protein 1A
VYADKTLGIEKEARFVQPESMKNEAMFDYMNIIDQTPPPGAEGTDQGNGKANEYLMEPDSSKVPVESALDNDEKKILRDATGDKKSDKPKVKPEQATTPDNNEKKKGGFFRRLFGNKKDKPENN